MYQDINAKYQKYMAQNRHRGFLKRIVSLMACVVIFCTTYALILPAITIEKETFCGVQEHMHTDACYAQSAVSALVCSGETLAVHTHSDSCYGEGGSLTCGQADYVAHSHDDRCYDSQGSLVCVLPERAAHVHGQGCYSAAETQPETLHTHSEACMAPVRGALLCTQQEREGHSHTESCYQPGTELSCTLQENHVHDEACYTYPLICQRPTEPHSHCGECYTAGKLVCSVPENHVHDDACMETRLVCENTEEGHVHGTECSIRQVVCTIAEHHSHTAGCYEQLVTCGKQEGEVHSHDAGCYSTEAQLICEIPENHIHSASCYLPQLVCTLEEDPGHAHSDDCYQMETEISCGLEEGQPEPTEAAEPVLVCTEPVAQVHIHGEGCFETTAAQADAICGITGEDHVHTSSCYALQCGMEEHTHGLACYSNPEADLETAEIWEATLSQVELTGKWPEDVVAIAQSQLGYAESTRNYTVWEDDTTHGYTRYGDWYGSPYGDWCAMFTSFCLHYARVEGMPLHWGVRPWIEELTQLKLYHEAEIYNPKPGDIIFYDWEGDGLSDHVGIVAEIIPATEEEKAQVKAIEGNSSNCVQYVFYDLDDSRILGYSELPENPEVYSCGILRHSHNEYCVDSSGNLICQQIEHEHDEDCERRDTLYCGLAEHTHGEACYNEAGELVCELTEHSHTEACTTEQAEETPPVYYCGLEEHTHDEACYNEAGELVCDLTEHTHTEECAIQPVTYYCSLEEHAHDEACYNEAGELVCELTEHTHTDECAIQPVTYYCSLEEHAHDEACYNEAGELVCDLTEHTHTEECTVAPIYYCGLQEHTHSEACYNEAGELVCELTEHTHTDECAIQPVTYYCSLEEHAHDEACYNEAGELVCDLTEHTHTEECTVAPIYYCGLQEHTHSEACYNEAGELVCDLTEHTHTDECAIQPVTYYCGLEEHTHSEACYNEAGELVCGLNEHTHSKLCTVIGGYVCGLEEHLHDENCYDNQGNLICTLPEHIHTDACKALNIYACGMIEHTHGAECYDENGNLICTLPEHIHTAACIGRSLYYSDPAVRVHAVIRGVENLPDVLTLNVVPITPETHPESYDSMASALKQQMPNGRRYIGSTSFYDLQLLSEGGVYTLPETASVSVTMEFTTPVFGAEEAENAVEAHSFLLIPEGVTPAVPSQEETEQESRIPEETEEASLLESVVDSITDAVAGLIPEASASELGEGDTGYNVSALTGENYGNQSQGITSVSFETNRLTTFGIALANESEMPTLSSKWERVESTSGLEEGENYLIVSAEGNYAFVSTASGNSVPVRIKPVKGLNNRTYYEIEFVFGDSVITCGKEEHQHTSDCYYWWGSLSCDQEEHTHTDTCNGCGMGEHSHGSGCYDASGNLTCTTPEHSHDTACSIGTTANLLWNFAGSNGSYTIYTTNGTEATYLRLSNGTLLGNAVSCQAEYLPAENCWRIHSGNYYLRFHENYGTTFTSSDAANTNYSSSTAFDSVSFYNARDMLIFKMLPEDTTFHIPADVVAQPSGGSEENPEPIYFCGLDHTHTADCESPDYADFIDTTGGIAGEEKTYVSDGTTTVTGSYYSDPSTSQLEKYFRRDSYEESQKIDGMVRTDKSVIYGGDDYGAFSSYENNTFSVTLSALGQAYSIPEHYQVETPMDVVFVLDCSSSMSNQGGNYPATARAKTMVDALNSSMEKILYDTENGVRTETGNRVGVVFYAAGATEILPVGRYDTQMTDGEYKYFDWVNGSTTVNLTGQSTSIFRVQGNDNLVEVVTTCTREEHTHTAKCYDGNDNLLCRLEEHTHSRGACTQDVSKADVGAVSTQGYGTYTQAGIAMGSKVFHDVEDTTYYFSVGEGSDTISGSVQRQPVFVLLSDGEPTYSTNMYTDALEGVHYGDGNGGGDLVRGVHGYYTILSANYYKRMIGIHYQRPALFYTVGLGIDSEGGYTDGTTDLYKRAVLDPSAERVSSLSSDRDVSTVDVATTSHQLYNLLNNNVSQQSLVTYANWPDDWTGVPHMYAPTMANPYSGNYDYADEAFFGEMTGDELAQVFDNIIEASRDTEEYGFVLFENTGVHVTDYIGSGMEIKGAPVLRYGGQNYYADDPDGEEVTIDGLTTTKYTYTGTFHDPYIPNKKDVDVSTIEVYITPKTHTPIYMCNDSSVGHVHTAEACGVYKSYLCGHHAHRAQCYLLNCTEDHTHVWSCYDHSTLICDDPHVHDPEKCAEITETQRIQMIVPDSALPVYTPELVHKDFYFEALPVRLIYQVGLTEQAEEAVLNLAENGGSLTFYTNRWGGKEHARSDLFPSLVNPFYYDQDETDGIGAPYHDHTLYKGGLENGPVAANNVTGTRDYATDCHWGQASYQNETLGHVYHELGNNGKLVFAADTVELPVEKKWTDTAGRELTDVTQQPPVTLTLYKVKETYSGETTDFQYENFGTLELNQSNGWSGKFTSLPDPANISCYNATGSLVCTQKDHDHVLVYYAVVESGIPDGYSPEYSANDGGTGLIQITPDNQKTVSAYRVGSFQEPVLVTVTNIPSTELPETGGTGTIPYTAGGLLLTAAALILMYNHIRNRRRGAFSAS